MMDSTSSAAADRVGGRRTSSTRRMLSAYFGLDTIWYRRSNRTIIMPRCPASYSSDSAAIIRSSCCCSTPSTCMSLSSCTGSPEANRMPSSSQSCSIIRCLLLRILRAQAKLELVALALNQQAARLGKLEHRQKGRYNF